ncbi:hypothetical protein AGMMS49940_17570 [Spirochaetia bacterium]|nr:hypothetical protein AGMMS49940_17570 [Spirochaetia bacterium]
MLRNVLILFYVILLSLLSGCASYWNSVRDWWDFSPPEVHRIDYNAVLTRTEDDHYILRYDGVYRDQEFHDELSAPSLEELLAMMSQNTAYFDKASIETVRAKAALLPFPDLTAKLLAEKESNP